MVIRLKLLKARLFQIHEAIFEKKKGRFDTMLENDRKIVVGSIAIAIISICCLASFLVRNSFFVSNIKNIIILL